jgi:hypothetical protein
MKLEFSRQILEKNPIPNFIKTRPVRAGLLLADELTDGQTGMTKLIDTFCSFVNALNQHTANKTGN